jgi:hypothetical protein
MPINGDSKNVRKLIEMLTRSTNLMEAGPRRIDAENLGKIA